MSGLIEVSQAGGANRTIGKADLLEALSRARAQVGAAWSPQKVDLVAGVSEQILKGRGLSAGPGVVHFAFWTRKGALRKLLADAQARLPADCLARPRGLVFHLPPQNVETVFLYSWVISYLAGNANLTRLPTSLGADMAALLDLFQTALADAGDVSQLFVRYPVSDDLNRALSAVSDARLVWGGNEKVRAFAPLPLRNGGKAVWFGDRRSLAMVHGPGLASLDANARRDLAERLHNDIFVFDQMACSSPQRLFVVGDPKLHGMAVSALMGDLAQTADARRSAPATGHVIRKMVAAMALSAEGMARAVTRHSNALTTVDTNSMAGHAPVGGGFLDVIYVAAPRDIYPALTEDVQTATHFGFSKDTLREFARDLPAFGVTRIVPVGQALDFDVIWDGYDLFAELTSLLRVA